MRPGSSSTVVRSMNGVSSRQLKASGWPTDTARHDERPFLTLRILPHRENLFQNNCGEVT
jgi:hypothetical protein